MVMNGLPFGEENRFAVLLSKGSCRIQMLPFEPIEHTFSSSANELAKKN